MGNSNSARFSGTLDEVLYQGVLHTFMGTYDDLTHTQQAFVDALVRRASVLLLYDPSVYNYFVGQDTSTMFFQQATLRPLIAELLREVNALRADGLTDDQIVTLYDSLAKQKLT